MTRKPIEEDARFQAAVEELKAAMVAVNGDVEVNNLLIYTAIAVNEERGFGFVMKDMHDCPYCIGLAGEAIFEVLREGEEHYKRQQAELAKLKH